MKKKLSILSLLLLFTMTAMAQIEVDGIYYYLNGSDNTAEVTRRPLYSGDIVIPASISVGGVDYSVTSIEDHAFLNCDGLRSIEIPNSVTSIGDDAFFDCDGLRSIVVEEGNSCYDSRDNCNAIIETSSNILVAGCQNTVIPNSVTAIGDHAFACCSSLTSIEIPNSVTSIGRGAFNSCSALTSIEIPNSVTSIGDYAFQYCSNLTSFEIPNSVTEIGDSAFYNCDGLTSIEIPNSVTEIGESAFYSCDGLTSIEIPNSVTEIGESAFQYCGNLTSITMQRTTPPTVGANSFSGCSKLDSIYVPIGAAEAYNVAPWNAYNIVEKEIEIINPMLVDGLYYNVDVENKTAEVVAAPNDTKYSGDIVVPASISINGIEFAVTSIGDGALVGCSTIISLAYSAPLLGASVFNSNSKPVVYAPDGSDYSSWEEHVKEIRGFSGKCGDNLYWNFNYENKTLSITGTGEMDSYSSSVFPWEGFSTITEKIDFSEGLTKISGRAFENFEKIVELEIPSSVVKIGGDHYIYNGSFTATSFYYYWHPFVGCENLERINVAPDNQVYYSENNAIIERTTRTLVVGCKTTIISSDVENIGTCAMAYCNIKNISIPYGVKKIGIGAFTGNNSLENISIPNSVEIIDCSAFIGASCTDIKIPSSVKFIGCSAFYNTGWYNAQPNGLLCLDNCILGYKGPRAESLVVDENVRLIVPGEHFADLKTITVHEDNPYFYSPNNSAVVVERNTETLVVGSQKCIIPQEVISIGDFAFCWYSGIQSINIPSNVKSIGRGAFDYCLELADVIIEEGVVSIEERAFCTTAIKSITIPNSVVTIGKQAFSGCSSMTSITMQRVTPPIAEISSFESCRKLQTIYVPAGAAEAYNVAPWNAYNIVESTADPEPQPIEGKYYILKSRLDGQRVAYEKNDGTIGLQENWATPSPLQMADLSFIWKANVVGTDSVRLQNVASKKYLDATYTLYQAYTTTEEGTTFRLTATEGSYYNLSDAKDLGFPYMHADASRSYVVRWEGASNKANQWQFVDVDAELVAPLLAQQDLNVELKAKLALLNEKIYQPIVDDFSNHGLLESASQLSTNKQETKEGHISNLLDGDGNTYFHSTWSSVNTDNAYHFIQADLKQTVDSITVKYVRRNHSYNDSPKSIRVFATNNPAGDWDEIAVLESPMQQSYFGIILSGGTLNFNLGNKYRYVRFVVEETHSGSVNNDNLFFSWSEFGIWDNNSEEFLPEDKRTEINNVIATAKQELKDLAATQSTIDQLVEWAAYVDKYVFLTDGEAYTNATEKETERIFYTREFKNTQWQSWYVPFDMDYNDISDEYTVACLNDIHEYDDDEDGILDRWAMEVLILRPGETIYANLPYVIRAKAVGEKQFVVENTMLYPADEQSMDCSSMRMHYTFTGTYSPLEAQVLRDNGWLAMGNGRLVTPTTTSTLKANRWYLESTPRKGYGSTYQAPKRIELVVVDENGEVTGIEELPLTEDKNAVWPADVYDLNGRLVKAQAKNLNDLPKGVYIVRGEKIVK